MLAFIVRIPDDFIRAILLFLIFPWYYLLYIMKAALPVSLGGTPNAERLLEVDFYSMPLGLFWGAMKGELCES